MTISINKLDLNRAGAFIERQLKLRGVSNLRLGNDVGEFEALIQDMGKLEVGEHFHRSITTLPPSRFLYLAALDETGKVIGTMATRHDNIEGWTLQRYVKEYWERAYKTEDGEPVRLSKHASLFAADIYGPLVYMGEGFLDPDWRGRGICAGLARYLTLLSWDEWKPKLIYGWMRPIHVMTGMHMKWGFTDACEAGIEFDHPPRQKDYRDLYFVACRKPAIRQMIVSLLRESDQAALNSNKENSVLWLSEPEVLPAGSATGRRRTR